MNKEDVNSSAEFKSLSPEKLRDLFDNDAKQLFPDSFSLREEDGCTFNSSKKPDFSMGAYFQGRSSFPILSGNSESMAHSHLYDLPEQDGSRPGSRIRHSRSLNRSMSTHGTSFAETLPKSPRFGRRSTDDESNDTMGEEGNSSTSSIQSLVDFFKDPDKSPMSSTAIMEHVLGYCKDRNQKRIVGVGNPHSIKSTRKHSESFQVLTRRVSEEKQRRDTETYNTFSLALSQKRPASRCSTPEDVDQKSPKSPFSPLRPMAEKNFEARNGCQTLAGSSFQYTKKEESYSHTAFSVADIIERRRTTTATPVASFKSRCPENIEAQRPSQSATCKENQVPAPGISPAPGLQLQINVPQASLPPNFQNFSTPLVINIVCPTSNLQSVPASTSRSTSRQDIVVRSSNNQDTAILNTDGTPRQPQIAIQFSGTIQFN